MDQPHSQRKSSTSNIPPADGPAAAKVPSLKETPGTPQGPTTNWKLDSDSTAPAEQTKRISAAGGPSKERRRHHVRLQRSRLIEVETNLRLLLEHGLLAKKSDAAILATAPRVRNTNRVILFHIHPNKL